MTAMTVGQGLEIPKLPCEGMLRLAALILPCLLASLVVGAVRPGSIIVLCFLLPLGFVARDLWPRCREPRVSTNALPALRRYQSFLASQHHPHSTPQASLPFLAESRRIALVIHTLDRTRPWHQSDWRSWTWRDAAMAQNQPRSTHVLA